MIIREFFRCWGQYRQLMRELKSYTDVELAELGIVRSACVRVAFDAAFDRSFRDAELGRGVPALTTAWHCAATKELDICSRMEHGTSPLAGSRTLRVSRGSVTGAARGIKNDAPVSIPSAPSANAPIHGQASPLNPSAKL